MQAHEEKLRKLTRIQGRHTLYEIVLRHPTKGRFLLCYGARSQSSILRYFERNGNDLARFCAADHFTKHRNEIVIGEWTITHSGRTQRESIIEGELPFWLD